MSTAVLPRSRVRRRRPMSLWRLEVLRMTRSPKAIILGAVYLTFGLLGPVLATYLQDIVNRYQSGMTIVVARPTPADGIANYVKQVGQTGLIVVVVVAAAAMTFDARRGISTYLRTRVHRMWQLVLPRAVVVATAAVAAYLLGTLAAWYETALLLGPPPPAAMLTGLLCGSTYLVFAVAATVWASSVARSTLGTVGLALAVVFLLPLLGLIAPLHDWLPSSLAAAPVELLERKTITDFLPGLVVAAASSVLLVVAGSARLARREV